MLHDGDLIRAVQYGLRLSAVIANEYHYQMRDPRKPYLKGLLLDRNCMT